MCCRVPGTLYREENLRFFKRAHVGKKLKVSVVCRDKREAPVAVFDTHCIAGRGPHQRAHCAEFEAGSMLAKELTFVARAEAAGLVLGAEPPVMLTSRADNDPARLASCALAQLY